MNTKVISSKIKNSPLFSKLANRKYRNLFVASQVNKGIPYQLRALRAARGMTQADLAEHAGTTQTVISRIENKGAGNLSVKTLLKLAEAFDVALVVRFEAIDKFIGWLDNFSPDDISFETSEAVLKRLAEGDATPSADLISPMRAGSATPHLRLAESPPAAAAAKSHTERTFKQQSLFERPQGVVGSAAYDRSPSPTDTIPPAQTIGAEIFRVENTMQQDAA